MSDENQKKDGDWKVEAVRGAKEVYENSLQPSVKQLGQSLETVMKTLNVTLAPFRLIVYGWDKIEKEVLPSIARKVRKIPEERRIKPNPSIAGPALEALRFTVDQPELREMFENLLATSMDSEKVQSAHPSFVEIIKQISPDEARIIRLFIENDHFPSISVLAADKIRYDLPMGNYNTLVANFCLMAEQASCDHPGLILTYVDNLRRLGFIEIFEGKHIAKPGYYNAIEKHPIIKATIDNITAHFGDARKPLIQKETIRVTALGKQFVYTCVAKESGTDYKTTESDP